jgi:hypothetical protein
MIKESEALYMMYNEDFNQLNNEIGYHLPDSWLSKNDANSYDSDKE